MSVTQTNALLLICDAITEAVSVAGVHGAPGGTLYSALMAHGCTLDQFEQIMSALVSTKRLAKRGECYFAPQSIWPFQTAQEQAEKKRTLPLRSRLTL